MLALLYDVHGNLPALEAVVADASAAGADRWLLGGDYVAFGPWPAECLARLRELDGAQWIRGNTDRWLLDPPPVEPGEMPRPALDACADRLGPQACEELLALPERLSLAEAHFSHASPLNDMESFAVEAQPDEDRLLDGVGLQNRRVVFGHTHVQFTRTREDGVELVNPGSVGMPLDGDHRAAYALIDDEGGLDLRRVEYDHEAAVAGFAERFGGAAWTEVYAGRIRNAAP
jgi:predicted phosphodiesterase